MPNDVFVSYAHEDSEFVKFLWQEFTQRGIDPWLDSEDIPVGEPWKEEMLLGVQNCQNFVFVISPDSVESDPCNKELACALRHNKRVIPVLLRPISLQAEIQLLHPVLCELHWARFDKGWKNTEVEKLIRAIDAAKGDLRLLTERPSAIVRIQYFDNRILDFPLNRSCYWIGRRPRPDERVAGVLIIPDRNPKQPIVSRFHAELKVINLRWFIFNRSQSDRRNEIKITPPSKDGSLSDGSEISIGHCKLRYMEIKHTNPQELPSEEFPPTLT